MKNEKRGSSCDVIFRVISEKFPRKEASTSPLPAARKGKKKEKKKKKKEGTVYIGICRCNQVVCCGSVVSDGFP